MIDLYVELKALLQALDAADIPYALCGGLALMVYQRPRATVDIDLILPAEVTGKCIEAVAPLGFRAHPRPMRFGASGIEVHRLYIEALQALTDQHPDAFPGSDNACP